jgi:hypothetical protein
MSEQPYSVTLTPAYIVTMTREQMVTMLLRRAQAEVEKVLNDLSDDDLRRGVTELFSVDPAKGK